MKTGEFDPRIKIRSPLRCDGIGRLDCAEDVESGVRLAVRWLPLEANGDAAVRACAKLPEHPTLPRIRQTGHMGDKAYVAMEFPDGRLLATMLGEPVSGELLLEIGAQLADALATIHSQRVYHGELAAESVLLAKGKAFLWDMPLVIANRLTDRRGEERLMHQLVRTAHYLPPERACGGGASAEGDVYSLAAVMCIAGGARLPQAQTTLAVVHKIATNEWAPEVPASFREPYRSLLLRMLDTEPGIRPTAREVADLLAKPVAPMQTIPEMPAIVMPPHLLMQRPAHPMLKTHRPSPFHSAPGALEPMLPSRAQAEAAVKADASRPTPAALVVKPDPTVRVIVPPSVLEAMSLGQEISVEPALKAMAAAAAATIPSLPTLPELRIPELAQMQLQAAAAADPLSALLSGLGSQPANAGPVPAPVESVRGSDPAKKAVTSISGSNKPVEVKAASVESVLAAEPAKKATSISGSNKPVEAKSSTHSTGSGHTSGPRSQAEVQKAVEAKASTHSTSSGQASGPSALAEVQKALEAKPVEAPAAEVKPGPVETPALRRASLEQVAMTDTVSVAHDLAAAGAATLSDDEADALMMLPRSRPTALLVAAVLAVVTTGVSLAMRGATSRPRQSEPVMVVPAPKVSQPVVLEASPAMSMAAEDDELSPLPVKPRPVIRPVRRALVAPRPAAVEQHEPAASGDDFALPQDDDLDALKRPSL